MGPLIFFGSICIGIGYVFLLLWLIKGWDDTAEWSIPEHFEPKLFISIVVAARNEELHIKSCIQSLISQNYPSDLFEIFIINDHSTDSTLEIIKSFKNSSLNYINLNEVSGKKAAISEAVKIARGSLIACTDADCQAPENWLSNLASYYEFHKPKLIAGPIVYKTDKSLIQRFQFLDGVANMAITAAGIKHKAFFMANGANIAYEKSLFAELSGYEGDSFASGDDMMLIQKTANKFSEQIGYLKSKESIVSTQPTKTIKELINQRKRWASKSMAYPDKGIIKVQGYVFLLVITIIINFLLIPFTNGLSLFSFAFLLFIKLTMDYLFLNKMSLYFDNTVALKSFFGASLWFIIYILRAGWEAFFPSKYRWKDRTVK